MPHVYDTRAYGDPKNSTPTFGDIRSAVQSGAPLPDHWWCVDGAWDYLEIDQGITLHPTNDPYPLIARLLQAPYNLLRSPIPLYTAKGQVCLDMSPYEFWRYANHVARTPSKFLTKTWEAMQGRNISAYGLNLDTISPVVAFFNLYADINYRPEPKFVFLGTFPKVQETSWCDGDSLRHVTGESHLVAKQPCVRLWEDELQRLVDWQTDAWAFSSKRSLGKYDPLSIF